jgi:Kdo2-lipid IVA lauroyltransferase/acyltransferase
MGRKTKTQIWLEYAVARGILGAFGTMPRAIAVKAGDSLAGLGSKSLKSLRRVAARNLEIAMPELLSEDREKIIAGSFKNLSRILLEMSRFPSLTREKLADLIEFRFDPELLEKQKKIRDEGRGTILVSPHLGNWELLVYGYSALHEPMSYLARPLDNPLLEDLTVRLRTRFGNRPINKKNSVPAAIKVLREAGLLGILADVNAHPKEGVFVPLFGVPACTSAGPATLAIRTDSVIIPLAGVWDETAGKYIAVNGDLIEPARTGDRQKDIVETTARFTAEVEKLIRAYPDQWLWIHKRWKTRPPGEPELY